MGVVSDNNNVPAYVSKVAGDLGIDSNAPLGSLKDNPELTANLITLCTTRRC